MFGHDSQDLKVPDKTSAPKRCRRGALTLSTALFLVGLWSVAAQASTEDSSSLKELSLEDLMSIEVTVTSVAKRPQRLADAAAAIYVLDQEDIRRSGATSIPELLRLVPGLQVARIDASKWAISSRGFNDRFANKLLVLMDGRTVYTPLFTGVFWERQDTILADIDRIEVIRGPGAALWGANAVNGVINIITKKAEETQGAYASVLVGTEDQAIVSLRYGAEIAEGSHLRAYAKYRESDSGKNTIGGGQGADNWYQPRVGFRGDFTLSDQDSLTLQGDIFKGDLGETRLGAQLPPPFLQVYEDDANTFGANILGRWTRQLSEESHLSLQIYYDHNESKFASLNLLGMGTEDITLDRNTFDVDFEHSFPIGDDHDILWGLGYRLNRTAANNASTAAFRDSKEVAHLVSFFLQDEWTLVPETLSLTLGSKFEYNSYTGFEYQPSAKVLWTPHTDHTLWFSAARAVRTPSRGERDARLLQTTALTPMGIPLAFEVGGDRDQESEELIALEAGYRVQPTEGLSLDFAGFVNFYDNLRSVEPLSPEFRMDPVPHLFASTETDNLLSGKTFGVEVAAEWQATDWWRLQGAYTYLKMDLSTDARSLDTFSEADEGRSPEHQFSLRSSIDITDDIEFDTTVRFVDSLPAIDVNSYVELDARIAWQPSENFELSIVGQNLLSNSHREFGSDQLGTVPSRVERSVYGQIKLKF